jgi:hypothetical protein
MCVTKFKFNQIRCEGIRCPFLYGKKIRSASRANQGMCKEGQKHTRSDAKPRRRTGTEGCRNGEEKFWSRKSRTRGLLAQFDPLRPARRSPTEKEEPRRSPTQLTTTHTPATATGRDGSSLLRHGSETREKKEKPGHRDPRRRPLCPVAQSSRSVGRFVAWT